MSVQTKISLWKGENHKRWLNTLFDEYIVFLSKSNKTQYTQEWEIKSLIYYFRYLENNNHTKVTLESVYNYVNYMNKQFSLRTIYDRSQCLKYFLNWLYDNKKITFNGEMIFPKLRQPINSSIISYYTNKEISQILNSISTKDNIGKRNFAIVSLFAYLGIRRDDVRTLKYENIDWDNNLIKFYQNKTDILSVLPMPKMVKFSLLDYLKNARPNVNNDFIFIKDDGSLYASEYLSVIVNRIVEKSGIDIRNRKYGCHSFRHSIATNLLEKHVDINVISKILGHSKTDNTINIYISYDKQKLMMLPMEVPEWK